MAERLDVSDDVVKELPDLQAAIRACILFSGIGMKTIAIELGIEQSHLSKMVNPSEDPRHFPPNKLPLLMDICGNDVPLRWLLIRRGYHTPREVADMEREIYTLRLSVERSALERVQLTNVFKKVEVPA